MVLYLPEDRPVLKQFSLTGKVAAVTGGSRGIGLAVCRGLAEAGADVALLYSSSTEAEALAAAISAETNTNCRAYKADVSDQKAVEAVIRQVLNDYGKFDILVANAGIATHVAAEDYIVDQWHRDMRVNLDGAFWCAQAAGRIFKAQGHGNVIFTSSVSAKLVNKPQKQAAYNASKAGVIQMAKCLAVEWVDFARVNCVLPGFIATELLANFPEEWKLLWPDMIPGAYVFLASDASSYMTGADLVVDAGYTLP